MDSYIVYCHINKINGKRYFGITSRTPAQRWGRGTGYKKCTAFARAIRKYGWDNFEHVIYFTDLTQKAAEAFETFFINHFNTINPKYGYNLTTGGGVCKMSDLTKKKQSEAKKQFWVEHSGMFDGPLNPHYGKRHSEETKQLLSYITLHRCDDPEYRKRLSESHKGKIPPNKGVPMSEEQKRKVSLAKKGCKPSHTQPVKCIELDRVFNSMREASKETNTNHTKICMVCRGQRKTAGGYHWQYI